MTKKQRSAEPFVSQMVKQVFASFTKRQSRNYLEEILEKLQLLDESIDIIAREMLDGSSRGSSRKATLILGMF